MANIDDLQNMSFRVSFKTKARQWYTPSECSLKSLNDFTE